MEQTTNGLGNAHSAYLRSARFQPVQWMEWGPEALARAQAENKPVLLDIGAVWCHWCHVMDRESYEDAETARLINEHFVAIKVDRDERPDVDARYQAAVAAISGQGGWPLTAFLTPTGEPYFGGTYFPPVDGHGRPSLRRVLMTMAEAFENRRDEVDESAASVMAAIESSETFDGGSRNPGTELIAKLVESALGQFDKRFGGFGSQPKFPNSTALDLLLDAASRPGPSAESARAAALFSLHAMARGGLQDQLAGGFHRYSVDERWVVPHFEKMLYDNAGLLKNYAHAAQSFADPECVQVARDLLAWVHTTLSDPEHGGYFSSQDADVSPEDDGDYFTWTRAEAAAVLTPDEFRVAGPWFDIGELGDMHHNPQKNVLHRVRTVAEIARGTGFTEEETAELIRTSRARLFAARQGRPAPYVDRTVYTGWNGMMISAALAAGRVLGDRSTTHFALKTLDRILEHAVAPGPVWSLAHVVAYGESPLPGTGRSVPGGLEDYVFTAHAALDAWELTGEYRYFAAALALAEATVSRFHDVAAGGFFDTDREAPDRIGALSARRKPLQDAPTPAGNPVAADLLLRLAELTGREDLRAQAQGTLELFAGVVEHFGLFAASYGLALARATLPAMQIVIVGADAAADALEAAALFRFAVNKSVIRLRTVPEALPPSLASTLPSLPPQPGSFALLCSGFRCQPPIQTPEALLEAVAPAAVR